MGGGSQTTQDTTSNQINQIPAWMSDAGQQNYAYAQQVAQQPLQQYQGQMVADTSPQTQQAWNVAANSGNVGSDQYNAATAGYLGALGQTPTSVTPATDVWHQAALANPTTAAQAATAQASAAQQAAKSQNVKAAQSNLSQLASTNLGAYMNPYTQDVINKTLPLMQQQLGQQQNAIQNQANSANAFGGSKQAINQGVLGAQGAMGMGQMAAQLNNQNYQQAQAAGMFDVGQANNMGQFNATQLNQVGLANQQQANQVGMFNAGQGNQVNLANAQMANVANQFNAGQSNQVGMYNQGQQNALAQFNAGQGNQMGMFNDQQINQVNMANQAAQQAKINSDLAASAGLTTTGDSMNKANLANFNMLQSAGAGQSMQQQNQINAQMAKFNQAFNYPQQQLGVLESSLGMTPHDTSTSGQSNTTTTTPTDWASILANTASAAGSAFSMMPSDRRMKKDIEKVGDDPVGVPAYAFRYKGSAPKSPKIVGPMAQDVQKVAPEAVGEMPGSGGKLGIHMPTLNKARGYAAGTPSVAAFLPPSSPGVAKGIASMSAFRPPVRMPRGFGVPKMQRFALGSADVQAPNMDDVDLGDQIMGGNTFAPKTPPPPAKSGGGASQSGSKGPPAPPPLPPGWNAPSMGYFQSGFAYGTPGVTDTVPAMLTPGEAVLTPRAAQHLGRGNIASLNAMLPPRGMAGALANTKRRPKIAGGLSG